MNLYKLLPPKEGEPTLPLIPEFKDEWPPLSNSGVPIIAQTGERILTREENKKYSEK